MENITTIDEIEKNDDYWVKLAQNAYTSSNNYFDAFVRPAAEEGMKQFQGIHANGSKYLTEPYKFKSKIFRQMTRKAIRKHEATAARALFSTEDVVSIRPVDDSNELHRNAADIFKFLLQYRLTRSIPWFLTAIGAYQEAMVNGVVCSMQDWEYDIEKGIDRPTIKLIPIENIRIDPASDWTDAVNTSPYIIRLIPMYEKDVKNRMKSGKWINLSEAQIKSSKTPVNDSTRIIREGKQSDSKDQSSAVSDFNVVWVHENIIEDNGKDIIFYTMGTHYLLTKPVDLKEKYFHGKRPFVIGNCIIEAHKTFPSSFCRIIKSPQDEANDLTNLRHDNIKLFLNKRYLALKNKNVDIRSLTRNVAGSVTMVTDHEDIKVLDTGDVTSSAYQEQDRINAEFDDLAGGFSGSSVMNNRNLNETVGGMNLLSSNGDLVSDYQLRIWIETWVEPVLRQLILLEREYETDATVLKLASKAPNLSDVAFDLLKQEVIISVNVGIGNTNPQNQVDRFMYGLSAISKLKPDILMKLNDEEVVKELFGKLGYRDGARFFTSEQPQPQIDPLDQEIKQATLEKIKAEIEQLKANATVKRGEILYSAMQTAQTAATIPGVVPIADEIAASVGFKDQNTPPVYPMPTPPAMSAVTGQINSELPQPLQQNTDPRFPAHPIGTGNGMMTGIETMRGEDNIR